MPGALPTPVIPGLTDLRVFARGGYATIFRATQVSVGREVAVKVENRTLDSERDQARFLREARAAGRMSSHPHVVDLFDVGVTPDQHPYLIMELCDGSYAERMRGGGLGAAEARDLGVKIADALAHSHASGVLHRDVKPANILYSHFNTAVLADFGLAVLGEMRDPTVTMEVLTPAYAAPEAFDHHEPSPAVDVYALCATLYAVMHGRPPRWSAQDRNPSLATVLELFHRPVPGLPGVPEELVDVLRHGMSNDPSARPSAVQLRDTLAALPLPGQPGDAGSASASLGYLPAPAIGAPGAPAPRSGEETVPVEDARARRWRPWFLGAGLVLSMVASAGAGAWFAGGGSEPAGGRIAQPSVTATEVGIGAQSGCAEPLPGGGRCTMEPECYGPLGPGGPPPGAEPVPCAGRHTWESYAVGDLPPRVAAADHGTVKADPQVRAVCNERTFRLATGVPSADGWDLEVLPVADRGTYRCLAGQGHNALVGPTLGG